MGRQKDDLHIIEKISKNAWPAEINEPYGLWELRLNDGVSKRANSVYTIGNMPASPNWLNEIEKFYYKNKVPPCFYISELSPEILDEGLALHHYTKVGEMYLMIADSKQVSDNVTVESPFVVMHEGHVSSDWINRFLQMEGFESRLFPAYEKIFTNIALKKSFVTIYREKIPVAVGTIAVSNDWGYISNIVVDHQFRRQGIARYLLRELAIWSLQNGGNRLFLQLLKNNQPAIHLYNQLGFEYLASSHYRIKQ